MILKRHTTDPAPPRGPVVLRAPVFPSGHILAELAEHCGATCVRGALRLPRSQLFRARASFCVKSPNIEVIWTGGTKRGGSKIFIALLLAQLASAARADRLAVAARVPSLYPAGRTTDLLSHRIGWSHSSHHHRHFYMVKARCRLGRSNSRENSIQNLTTILAATALHTCTSLPYYNYNYSRF